MFFHSFFQEDLSTGSNTLEQPLLLLSINNYVENSIIEYFEIFRNFAKFRTASNEI